jgi:hypothetical protein
MAPHVALVLSQKFLNVVTINNLSSAPSPIGARRSPPSQVAQACLAPKSAQEALSAQWLGL